MKSSRRTTLRKLVDARLTAEKTSLVAFVESGIEAGNSYEDLTFELRQKTGIPISSRTLRRWIENSQLEGAA